MNNEVVVVSEVSKNFTIHSSKSFKERLVDVFTRRKPTKFVALNNISLSIKKGETVGLVGHNGSGKSTLLKLIGGIIDPSAGQIAVQGRIAALLELGAGFHPDLTGRENIYLNAAVLGLSKAKTDEVIPSIIDFSGLEPKFIDTQVKFYSSGMYVRLAFAVAIHTDPDILLVDEVLAVGDEPFQAKCMAKIHEFQASGKTIIFVSHSADQVAEVCSKVVVLNHGDIIYQGPVAQGLRRLRESFEATTRNATNSDSYSATPGSADSDGTLAAEVTDIQVHVGNKGTHKPAELGDEIRIDIMVAINKPTKWITGFTLSNHLGQTIYLLNSKGMKVELPSEVGKYTVSFSLPETNFGSEWIAISAGVTDELGNLFNNLHTHVSFDVERDPRGHGFLQFDPKISWSGPTI